MAANTPSGMSVDGRAVRFLLSASGAVAASGESGFAPSVNGPIRQMALRHVAWNYSSEDNVVELHCCTCV